MAQQLDWHLSFTGIANDHFDENKKRQQGIGQLLILQDNGTEIASFDAISGPGKNGLLPNGKYKVSKIIMDLNFPDEQNLSFKMRVNPVGTLAVSFARTGLYIHPVQHRWSGTINGVKQFQTSPTDGCIGVVGNANAQPFLEMMKDHFSRYDSIELEVDIIDNANVKIQLHDRLTYA